MNTSTDRRVAVIGLGAMGGAMAATLHRAGWDVTGFDPSEAARAAAAEAGIATTANLADLAGTPYAVLSLPAASIVEATVPQLLAHREPSRSSTPPPPNRPPANTWPPSPRHRGQPSWTLRSPAAATAQQPDH